MIRPVRLSDIPAIEKLAFEALNRNKPDAMVISVDKIHDMCVECASKQSNFAWVSEKDGVVTGCVAALVHEILFFERKQCSVVMYYCNEPGEGIKMLRELMKWVKKRPIIKMVEFTLERQDNKRVQQLLKRLGLTESLPILMYIK